MWTVRLVRLAESLKSPIFHLVRSCYVTSGSRSLARGFDLERVASQARNSTKSELRIPDDLAVAFTRNKKAAEAFHGFSQSHRREYVQWITEAKREETRQKRIATALEWLAQGKPRNWKYMNC